VPVRGTATARPVVNLHNDSRGGALWRLTIFMPRWASSGLQRVGQSSIRWPRRCWGSRRRRVVIGAAAWYEPLGRRLPTSTPPQVAAPTLAKPEVAASAPALPRVQVIGTAASRPLPQVTGAISPAGALDGGKAQDQPAAPGSADRIITIIDGRSGARQEVRIPATSDAANAPLPDPGFGDLLRGGTLARRRRGAGAPSAAVARQVGAAETRQARASPVDDSAPQAPLR